MFLHLQLGRGPTLHEMKIGCTNSGFKKGKLGCSVSYWGGMMHHCFQQHAVGLDRCSWKFDFLLGLFFP